MMEEVSFQTVSLNVLFHDVIKLLYIYYIYVLCIFIYMYIYIATGHLQKVYLGTAEGNFKRRYYHHKKSFRNRKYANETSLSNISGK